METLRNRLTDSRSRLSETVSAEAEAWRAFLEARARAAREDARERLDSLPLSPAALERRVLSTVDVSLVRAHERLTARLSELEARVALGGGQPLDGYDELKARDVVDRLEGLGVKQLREVERYERDHKARKTVLEALEQLLT